MLEWAMLTDLEMEEQEREGIIQLTASDLLALCDSGQPDPETIKRYVRVPCEASARTLVNICSAFKVLPNEARKLYNEAKAKVDAKMPVFTSETARETHHGLMMFAELFSKK